MPYDALADAVLVLHLAFVLFTALGGLLALWAPRLAWCHVPAVIWGAWIEFSGGICPLTPLENALRRAGGGDGYQGDFIARYLVPIVYPDGLTRELQVALGAGLVLLNAVVYAVVWRRRGVSPPAPGRDTSRE